MLPDLLGGAELDSIEFHRQERLHVSVFYERVMSGVKGEKSFTSGRLRNNLGSARSTWKIDWGTVDLRGDHPTQRGVSRLERIDGPRLHSILPIYKGYA
jgi:hypothetical protein